MIINRKLALVFILIAITSIFIIIFHNSFISLVYSLTPHNAKELQPVKDEYSFLLVILALLGVIVVIVGFFIQPKSEKRNSLIRSTAAILRELDENKKSLSNDFHEHIKYNPKNYIDKSTNTATEQTFVSYTDAYLEIDAYESVLASGLFTHFSEDTQYTLNMVYSRIRRKNELITYRERFEDTFFMNDDSDERKLKWYKKVVKYDILLTGWEKEIKQMLYDAENKVKQERPRSFNFK